MAHKRTNQTKVTLVEAGKGRVVAGWNFGASLESTPGKNRKVFSAHPFLFGPFSIFCFRNGTDLCSLYLFHLQVWKQ